MIGVWMTPCKNGQCKLSVRRDGINKIVIATQTPLTDAQAEELFWCVGAMQKSGKTLKGLLKEQEAVKPVRDKEIGRIWLCGNCGTYVGFEDHDENDPNEFDKYCRECGHPVLWKGR